MRGSAARATLMTQAGVRGQAIDDPAADEAGRAGHGNRLARQ